MKKQSDPQNNNQLPISNDQTESEEIQKLKKELEETKTHAEEKNNAYLRALADYHNLERRFNEEREKSVLRERARVLSEVLHIKEDIEKAAQFDTSKALSIIVQKFDIVLKKLGLKEIEALNQEFSPETMECIEAVEGEKENMVVRIYEKGYVLNDMLIKAAKVAVSKKKLQVSNDQLPNEQNDKNS